MALIGEDSLEEKVKAKMIYDAQKQKKSDAKKAAAEKSEKMIKKAQWKEAKGIYENKRDEAVKKVADRMMATWEAWNIEKRGLTQNKETPENIEKARTARYDAEEKDITDILRSYDQDITTYIEKAKELKPSLAKNLTHDNQHQLIKTMAGDDFAKRVETQMSMANALAKLKAFTQNSQFDTDKINQELSNLPLKVEEIIDQVKTTLDTLLGKLVAPMFQPEMPEFDIDALIAQIKVFLNPVLMSTQPLTAVVGKIPIIGELSALLQMLSSGSGTTVLSKEELKKLLPKKPELDSQLMDKLKKIGEDILLFCMTLPTILIQVIFAMIDVIWSKLKIITSVIPLGGMFPLSLLPAAIDATPKILKLIKVLPGMVFDCVKGLLMDKLWEAMALAFPTPNIDLDSLNAMADDINEQNAAKKSKAKERKDYSDITKEIYESQLSALGYTQMQAKTVQKNYKEIYNGTDVSKETIKGFVDNGREQNLPNATWNSITNAGITIANGVMATGGELTFTNAPKIDESKLDESNMEAGFTENEITRRKPSVEDYEAYFKSLIAKSDLSSGLKYEKIKPTSAVVGEWYETYKAQLEKYGNEVVLEEKMTPPLLRKISMSIGAN